MWKTAFKIFWRDKAYPLKFFKGCLPQILLDPLLNTLPQLLLLLAHSWRIFAFCNPENTKKLQISFQDKYDQLTLVVRKMRLTKTILFIIFLFLWFYWNDQFFTFKQKLLLFMEKFYCLVCQLNKNLGDNFTMRSFLKNYSHLILIFLID